MAPALPTRRVERGFKQRADASNQYCTIEKARCHALPLMAPRRKRRHRPTGARHEQDLGDASAAAGVHPHDRRPHLQEEFSVRGRYKGTYSAVNTGRSAGQRQCLCRHLQSRLSPDWDAVTRGIALPQRRLADLRNALGRKRRTRSEPGAELVRPDGTGTAVALHALVRTRGRDSCPMARLTYSCASSAPQTSTRLPSTRRARAPRGTAHAQFAEQVPACMHSIPKLHAITQAV